MIFKCPMCPQMIDARLPIIGAHDTEKTGHAAAVMFAHLQKSHPDAFHFVAASSQMFTMFLLFKLFANDDAEFSKHFQMIQDNVRVTFESAWQISHVQPADAPPQPATVPAV